MNEFIIYIPTKGRINSQLSYNALPAKYKAHVRFVVTADEYNLFTNRYGADKVLQRPADCEQSIAQTRRWITQQNKTKFCVMDDDIYQFYRILPADFSKVKMESERDFDDMFQLFWGLLEKYVHCGMTNRGVRPAKSNYPFNINGRIVYIVFYNGAMLPQDIEWTRVPHAEDFDVNLQLLTRGFQNYIDGTHCVNVKATAANGGCNAERSLNSHNQSQRILAELWPAVVNTRETVVKTGQWKGLKKISVTIYWKKAFLQSKPKAQK